MDGTTQKVSEYIKQRELNLSDISRNTQIPYMALYDSLFNKKRARELRVNEFLVLCKYLDVNPMIFSDEIKKGDLNGKEKARIESPA